MPVYEEDKLVNGQKRYYIRTYVEGPDGKRKQIKKHNKLWVGRDGKFLAQQEENKLKQREYNNYQNITLDETFEMFITNYSTKNKISTTKLTINNYNMYIKPVLGFKKIFNLNNKDILNFHDHLNNILTKNNTPLSLKYKKDIHITLTSILKFACKYLELNKNVASIVGNFKAPKGSIKKELNFLTIDEFNNFINFESNEMYKDFFTILFFSGIRRGELLALTINDVDFDKNTLSINKALNPKNGLDSTVPKTNKSNRTLTMTIFVRNALIKYKDVDGVIFPLDKITMTTLARRCNNNCKKAGIEKNIRIHDFRHSFASMCINLGVPIEILSQYLGHENISTTLDTYSHLYPNSQNKLVELVNKQVQKQVQ